jgi:hypothetical protein
VSPVNSRPSAAATGGANVAYHARMETRLAAFGRMLIWVALAALGIGIVIMAAA